MFLTQYRLLLQEQAKWACRCLNERAGQSAAAAVPVPQPVYAGADLKSPRTRAGFLHLHLGTSLSFPLCFDPMSD